ncbi:hypothetical protein EDD22DRAFT_1005047, partial [Suillus occidentalis]
LDDSLCHPRIFLVEKQKLANTISTEHSCGFALSPQNLRSGHRSALSFLQDSSSRIMWVQVLHIPPTRLTMLQSTQANANRLVFLFLLQTGKLYTLSNLRTLNAKVKLRERMKSDDFARGSLGNWSWRQADSGVDHEMSMSATVTIFVPGGNKWTPVVDFDWAVGEEYRG